MLQLLKLLVPKRSACTLLQPQTIYRTDYGAACILLFIRVMLLAPQLRVVLLLPERAVSGVACHVCTLLLSALHPDRPKPPY